LSITWVGKILIFENSCQELELMSCYLRDKGYKIIKASNAKEALEIALEEKPDAIVTDAVMPGMSGFELCRFLKRNSSHQQVPIVVCSDENQAIHRYWARKQCADAYVTKSCSGEDLLSAIQSVGNCRFLSFVKRRDYTLTRSRSTSVYASVQESSVNSILDF
jgi:two-component system, chemotaxis family, response regulator PixH